MDAAWRAWHDAALQAPAPPVQPHHESTLLVRGGAAWDSLDIAGRQRMVRATELAVADDFILFKQLQLYAYRQLRREAPFSEATRGMVQDTLVHIACFRRYARRASESSAFYGDALPGQLGRGRRRVATRILCWLLHRAPNTLHSLMPIFKSLSLVYARAILRDRRDARDPWRALHALHQRDESEHLGACSHLLAEASGQLHPLQRWCRKQSGRAALGLLCWAASGNHCGVWRVAWEKPPSWEVRAWRLRHILLGRGGHRGLYITALRQSRVRLCMQQR